MGVNRGGKYTVADAIQNLQEYGHWIDPEGDLEPFDLHCHVDDLLMKRLLEQEQALEDVVPKEDVRSKAMLSVALNFSFDHNLWVSPVRITAGLVEAYRVATDGQVTDISPIDGESEVVQTTEVVVVCSAQDDADDGHSPFKRKVRGTSKDLGMVDKAEELREKIKANQVEFVHSVVGEIVGDFEQRVAAGTINPDLVYFYQFAEDKVDHGCHKVIEILKAQGFTVKSEKPREITVSL